MKTKETKICPHCGKEILAVAKKCKYCKEWVIQESNTHSASQRESENDIENDNIISEVEASPSLKEEIIEKPVSTYHPPSVSEEQLDDEQEDEVKPRNYGKWWILIAIMVLASMILFMRGNGSSDTQPSDVDTTATSNIVVVVEDEDNEIEENHPTEDQTSTAESSTSSSDEEYGEEYLPINYLAAHSPQTYRWDGTGQYTEITFIHPNRIRLKYHYDYSERGELTGTYDLHDSDVELHFNGKYHGKQDWYGKFEKGMYGIELFKDSWDSYSYEFNRLSQQNRPDDN